MTYDYRKYTEEPKHGINMIKRMNYNHTNVGSSMTALLADEMYTIYSVRRDILFSEDNHFVGK